MTCHCVTIGKTWASAAGVVVADLHSVATMALVMARSVVEAQLVINQGGAMYTILIETANLMETPSYVGEDGKARYLGSGTQGVVYFTLYGEKNHASQQIRMVSTGSDAGKVFYGQQAIGVSVDVNGLPDRKPFQQGKTARLALTTELLPTLGKLTKLVIGHTPTDAWLGWYLKRVIITDETGQSFVFPCNRWLIADESELSLPVEATNGGDGSDNGGDTGSGGDEPTPGNATSLVLLVVTASIEGTPDYISKGKNVTLKLGPGTTVPVIFQIGGERGQSGEVRITSGGSKSRVEYQGKAIGQAEVEDKPDSEPFDEGKTARIKLPPDPSLDLGKLQTLSIKTAEEKDFIGNKTRDGRAWFLKEVTIINDANQQFLFRNKDKKWLFVPEQRSIELTAEIPA